MKNLCWLILILVLSTALSAQDITGTWTTPNGQKSEWIQDGQNVYFIYNGNKFKHWFNGRLISTNKIQGVMLRINLDNNCVSSLSVDISIVNGSTMSSVWTVGHDACDLRPGQTGIDALTKIARPSTSPMNAFGGAAYNPRNDLTGSWGDSGGCSDWIENELFVSYIFNNPGFKHYFYGSRSGNTITGTLYRTNRSTGCRTTMNQVFTVADANVMSHTWTGNDSNCDLARGQTDGGTLSRCLPQSGASGRPVMSNFDPKTHGFKFSNTFKVQLFQAGPLKDITFDGQCGGMAYAALDYYNRGQLIPNQTWRPALNTTLQRYIFGRQLNSMGDNADKWSELFFNPGGERTTQFFNWGLQGTNGGRIQELRQSLDAGNPVPLGLFKAGNGGTGPHHQVLAIGYEMGRYQGDLGNFKEDFKIFIYDPNHPGETVTLSPNPSNFSYSYREHPSEAWMTYFVDKKYRLATPPAGIPSYNLSNDGLIRFLLLEITTGGDDLRGGTDNVGATIHYKNGTTQAASNINLSTRWSNNLTEYVPIVLTRAVRKDELDKLVLKTTFGGGIGGDNWNMDGLKIFANGNQSAELTMYNNRGTPLSRFNGNNLPFEAKFFTKQLLVEVVTGGDDLRGHSQAYVTLHYRNGSNSGELPLNRGAGWGGGSFNTVNLDINAGIATNDVVGVTIRFDGNPRTWPDGYDNWNLDKLKITLDGTVLWNLAGTPLVRFTGALRQQRWNR